MYGNAGILSAGNIGPLPNNRHVPTTSDPPHATDNSFSSLSSLNISGGHATRRSDDGILSTSAALPRSASVQVIRSTGRTTTTILAPPSSFYAHSKTSASVSSFTRNPSHAPSSSSTPSVSTYSNINHKISSGSTTSLFLSRTASSKPAAKSTPSVSRSSSISRRNGSSPSAMAPVEPVAPQRINMRRLMSKPTAILVPDRAQSVMAFAQPPPDTDDTRSMEDYLTIKSRSLDILRRTRRRSRSVDLIRNYGGRVYPPLSPEGPLYRTTASTGSPPVFVGARLSAGGGRARGLTRSPSIPNTERRASILLSDYNRVDPRLLNSDDEDVNFPLSPASAIAIAWTESQKHANPSSPIAGRRESSSSSTIPQSGFGALDYLDSTSVSSPILFADANEVSYQITPPTVTNSPMEREESQEDDYTPWGFAKQGLSSHSQPAVRDVSSPSMKGRHDGNKVGLAATMLEVSRRFTGAFGRRERKQEKPAVARFPINHPTSSVSMASFPPNLEFNTSSPSSFNAKPVSKAPKSHERARSLTLSRITGPVKTEPLSNNQLSQTLDPPLVAHRQPANSKPFTIEFGQLNHTPLSTNINTSPQVNFSERDSSLEVATPRQLPPLEMPNWSLLHSPSTQQTTVGENGQTSSQFASSTLSPMQFASSPLSSIHPDRGQIPTPARSNTPNTLKKRSRPSLRAKPAPSAVVPVGSIATEGTETTGAHSADVMSSNLPSLALKEGTVTSGKLRGLVKKLSSGALARISSQSDRSQSSRTSAGGRENSPPISRQILGAGAGAGDVPPVPQIPKDFDLILDADAYFAERTRLRGDDKFDSDGESIPSGQGSGGPNTTLRMPSSSQMSSGHSSVLGHIPTDVSSLSSSLKSRLRVDTEIDQGASSSKQQPVSVHRQKSPSAHKAYTFRKRANTTAERSSSSNSHADYIGLGYRSLSPSRSSADLHSVNKLYSDAVAEFASGSLREKKSLSSHSHEMVSSYPNSILAQPIMSPKDLYQHGEDEAATLRRQQNKESANHPLRRKRSGGTVPASHSREQSSAGPPPPTISPSLLPLTAPPPRPPRRFTRVQSSTMLNGSIPRATHRHRRSLSSPVSPTIPTFLTTKAAHAIPPSKRSRSVSGSPRPPQPSTSTEALPSSATTQAKRARSNSFSKKAKHLPHLVVRSRGLEPANKVSPNPPSGGRSAGEGGSQPLKTSSGTGTRARSVVTPKFASSPKSASHTPSSSTSYTLSPQSSGHRSSSSRTSRDHSFGQGWVTVDDGEAPPVPFTSTAFTFKEISPVTGPSPAKGKALTEGEREDLWNALLSRSDRVGGTLTITMDQTDGPALLSDNASFRDD